MKKNAIYPGSFDPITNGHIDLIKRASKLFDTVIIGITQNSKKVAFLSVKDRIESVETALQGIDNIKVLGFDTLLVDFAEAQNAQIILRGLRAVSDFEYEFQLSGMNKHLNPNIETLFMTPAEKYANISSSLVREILSLNGDISAFVPKNIEILLKETI
ncbi:MAG: pantetheine-phosphate adenylyltransferase [Gammaproteobacteria bacterium]|uniref:Phosphopantetheine adenylyltransferase n=1 Tax=endosymbiont of Bathymodiolus septemdierum str. Myojin knoll TaxID=1303921 RepID=A0A0P0URZ6_9GAMM|nr:pantetheine-phosphate adenylyltransferase [Bathymodiolus septemdierum thioautotrophic gill symbiont]RUA06229.1 MAG: pantetheine-phosphate adenylyltransferase [Gammaproteobacteria bacterium]BAS68033.1 pantetheine-phosphate adenylyltransferase [endosymbiont of Bathymodiolus septemdierum str. Myojin knoll]